MKMEREKVIPFEFDTGTEDIGTIRLSLTVKRRTPNIETMIAQSKAQLLAGFKAASDKDDLWFEAVATLANAVEPVGLTDPNWIENVLQCREAVFAVYNRWIAYQNSFKRTLNPDAQPQAQGAASA